MPSVSRAQQRVEAKYNVTTEFPRYDLHFAAASGNLGLVEFALSHGQPVNSVLNGVLPLHAACAGGSEIVVKYLIDEGADVNAQRVPRRYSNEKHKSSSIAVGASGSTPLHFAAANGHLNIVRMLLAHGADPTRADKHGVTAAILARDNGWIECADALDIAVHSFSSDANGGAIERGIEEHCSIAHDALEAVHNVFHAGSRKLQVKRSIDNAFSILKNHHHSSSLLSQQPLQTQHTRPAIPSPSDPSSPVSPKPLGEYNFYAADGTPSPYNEERRPSLPHIFGSSSAGQGNSTFGGIFQRSTSSETARSSKRRPRSAGTGSEQNQVREMTGSSTSINASNTSPGSSSSHVPRRLGSKISLMHLFKRGNASGSTGASTGVEDGNAMANSDMASSSVPYSRPIPFATPPFMPSPSLSGAPSSSPCPIKKRFGGNEMHDQKSSENFDNVRLHAHPTEGSNATAGYDVKYPQTPQHASLAISSTSNTQPRPSILRTHHRSSSSQSSSADISPNHSLSPTPISSRTLRFDSSATPPSPTSYASPPSINPTHVQASRVGRPSVSIASKLRSSRSAGSFAGRLEEDAFDGFNGRSQADADIPESAPPHLTSFCEVKWSPSRHDADNQGRSRGTSFTSSGSASPGLPSPPSVEEAAAYDQIYRNGGFPFSISSPPANNEVLPLNEIGGTSGITSGLVPNGDNGDSVIGGRGRGLSLSSADTDNSGSVHINMDSNAIYSHHSRANSPNSSVEDLGAPVPPSQSILRVMSSKGGDEGHRNITPLDLSSISNHAEVRALAEYTEQEILRTASLSEDDPESASSLAAQLEAYGEILALERKLKRFERQRIKWSNHSDGDDDGGKDETIRGTRSAGVWTERTPKMSRVPMSAPPGDAVRKYGSSSMLRSVSTGQSSPYVDSSANSRHTERTHRPHTSDGSIRGDVSRSSMDHAANEQTDRGRSYSLASTLEVTTNNMERRALPSIQIIETVPTPIDSPSTPDILPTSGRYSLDSSRPTSPRARTPDLMRSRDTSDVSFNRSAYGGFPLTRVSTAPTNEKLTFEFAHDEDISERRSANVNKLARMGIGPEMTVQPHVLTFPGTAGTRSPSKSRFGIKSIVQSLKGR